MGGGEDGARQGARGTAHGRGHDAGHVAQGRVATGRARRPRPRLPDIKGGLRLDREEVRELGLALPELQFLLFGGRGAALPGLAPHGLDWCPCRVPRRAVTDPRELLAERLALARGDADGPEVGAEEVLIEELDGALATEHTDGATASASDPKQWLAARFSDQEVLDLCESDDRNERHRRMALALAAHKTGKEAFFKTVGPACPRPWSDVVLDREVVSESVPGGELEKEEVEAKPDGPRRHQLFLAGVPQRHWRCEVHNSGSFVAVVCRGPAAEVEDPEGDFAATLLRKFLEVDVYDTVLEHTEPAFLQLPIQRLLPEKHHTDYARACGQGERGDQLRMNR